MKHKVLPIIFMVIMMALGVVQPVLANSNVNSSLAQVRRATAALHSIPAAKAAGYQLVPGLDYCFSNPGVGGMGYHLINTSLLDTNVDALHPEAMVYAPGRNGQLHLVAVEYIVPMSLWDAAFPGQKPSLFGRDFEPNTALGVYALHAWIWKSNSLGMFNDWNPKVTCPN